MNIRTVIRILGLSTLYAVLFFVYQYFSVNGQLKDIQKAWSLFLVVWGIILAAACSIRMVLRKSRHSYREKTGLSLPFFLSGSLVLVLSLVWTLTGSLLFRILFYGDLPLDDLKDLYPGMILQVLLICLFTGLVYSLVDHSLDSFRHLQEMRLSTRKVQTEQMNLRFESLRNQISPHFLFNSLNTISSLVYRDTRVAEKFIRNLASVYLSVLESYSQPLVELSEELRLVRHYSYLMQVRFEDAFNLEIEPVAGDSGFYIPPLSVQMLVENAIKHNHMSLEIPLTIKIYTEDGYLVVRNNFIGERDHVRIGNDLYRKPEPFHSRGIGLENIRNRYRLVTRKPVRLSRNGHFTVSIPLITQSEAKMVHT
jgi:sensor histidine kinase YesM